MIGTYCPRCVRFSVTKGNKDASVQRYVPVPHVNPGSGQSLPWWVSFGFETSTHAPQTKQSSFSHPQDSFSEDQGTMIFRRSQGICHWLRFHNTYSDSGPEGKQQCPDVSPVIILDLANTTLLFQRYNGRIAEVPYAINSSLNADEAWGESCGFETACRNLT